MIFCTSHAMKKMQMISESYNTSGTSTYFLCSHHVPLLYLNSRLTFTSYLYKILEWVHCPICAWLIHAWVDTSSHACLFHARSLQSTSSHIPTDENGQTTTTMVMNEVSYTTVCLLWIKLAAICLCIPQLV